MQTTACPTWPYGFHERESPPQPLRLPYAEVDCITELARRLRAGARRRTLVTLLVGQVTVAAASLLFDPAVVLAAVGVSIGAIAVPSALFRARRMLAPIAAVTALLAGTAFLMIPQDQWGEIPQRVVAWLGSLR